MRVIRHTYKQVTELILSNGDSILFSYETPVACRIRGKFFRTATNWSRTTNSHINQYLYYYTASAVDVISMPQEWFDNLLEDANRTTT
jgi:hypothetical protein